MDRLERNEALKKLKNRIERAADRTADRDQPRDRAADIDRCQIETPVTPNGLLIAVVFVHVI